MCATALVVAVIVEGDRVALAGLRATLHGVPPSDRAVVVAVSLPADQVAVVDGQVAAELDRGLQQIGGERERDVTFGPFAPVGTPLADAGTLTQLTAYGGIERHATLVSGHWPAGAGAASPGTSGQSFGSTGPSLEAALSEGASHELSMPIGSHLSIADRLDPSVVVNVVVTGIWRPNQDDPYWHDDPLALTGIETVGRYVTRGPFAVDSDSLIRTAGSRRVDVEWRSIPALDNLRVDQVDALRSDLLAVNDRLAEAIDSRPVPIARTALPDLLAAASRSIGVSRVAIVALTLQFGALAGYAVVLVAGMLAERRRLETALLRSRGATSGHILLLGLAEAVTLAIPAMILAPLVALVTVGVVAGSNPGLAGVPTELTSSAIMAAVVAGICGVLAFTVPSAVAGGSVVQARIGLGRQLGATFAQRLGIDVALVAIAAIGLWQMRLYGAPLVRDAQGRLGIDPLLIAAPALGLLAGAIVATRFAPRFAEAAERLLGRRGGVRASIGARQLARRPLRYTRSLLLLILAAALGTFGFAYGATWSHSQQDQAAYAAGADERVIVGPTSTVPSWAIGPADRSIPGVAGAMRIVNEQLEVGTHVRSGRLIGIDPDAAPAIAYDAMAGAAANGGTGGESGVATALPRLSSGRPQIAGAELPTGTTALTLVIDAGLAPVLPRDPEDPPDAPAGLGMPTPDDRLDVTVVIANADGVFRVGGGSISYAGTGQRSAVPLTASVGAGGPIVAIAEPASLVAVELTFDGQVDVPAAGRLELTAVTATTAGGEKDLTVRAGSNGWSLTRLDGPKVLEAQPDAAHPNRVTFVPGDRSHPVAMIDDTGVATTVRLSAVGPASTEMAAIAGSSFLADTGAQVGDTVAVTSHGYGATVRIVGSVDRFAPIDPATPFLLVDRTTLEQLALADWNTTLGGNEWWLHVDEGADPAVHAALSRGSHALGPVVGRAALLDSAQSDPLASGVIGALQLGALGALLIAAIAFLVAATVTTTERLGEFAIFRALGIPARALTSWLGVEQALVLVIGLAAGAAIGLLLAALVVPFSPFTRTGVPAVPPPTLVIPWGLTLPIVLVGVGLLVASGVIVRGLLAGIVVAARLREGEP